MAYECINFVANRIEVLCKRWKYLLNKTKKKQFWNNDMNKREQLKESRYCFAQSTFNLTTFYLFCIPLLRLTSFTFQPFFSMSFIYKNTMSLLFYIMKVWVAKMHISICIFIRMQILFKEAFWDRYYLIFLCWK